MQARVTAEHEAEQGRGRPDPRGAARPSSEPANVDPHLVTKLAAEGWLEHTRE